MDAVTAALAAGAAAGLTSTAARAVQDAYAQLKATLRGRFPLLAVHVEALEARPDSAVKQSSLSEELVEAGAEHDAELLRLAYILLEAIRQHAPDVAIRAGVDLERVRAGGSLHVENARGGEVGVRGRDIEVADDIRIRGARGRRDSGPKPVGAAGAGLSQSGTGAGRPIADLEEVRVGHDLVVAGRDVVYTTSAPRALPPDPKAGLPPDPIEHFVGRETELAELRRQLERRRRVVIQGLGGVGKTQVALRYLTRHLADYPDGRFWLRGELTTTLVGDVASLAWRLGLPEREALEQERQIDAVLRWLREHQRWLLVVDNLDQDVLRELEPVLPPGLTGHILATSRRRLQGAARLALQPLPSAVAVRFLLQRTGQDDARAARSIADAVGGLPLALEQAAAYVGISSRSLASYAGLLEHRLAELLDDGRPQGYPYTVATTWDLSFRGLEKERPAAADLLRLCAYFAADDIPLALIGSAAGELPGPLGPALQDEIESDRIVATLSGYSLLERHGDAARVHRIVQLVIRESLGAEQRGRWLNVAVGMLRTLFPADAADSERWPLAARLVPHAQAAIALTPRRRESAELLELMDRVARYLHARARYAEARSLFERALACRERTLGSDHLDSVRSAMNLAIVLRDQGKLGEAGRRLAQALPASERTAGADHPVTATLLIHLGSIRLAEGDLVGARRLFERVIAAGERALFSHSPETIASTRSMLAQIEDALPAARPNLALLFNDPDEFAAVKLLFQRAVALAEQVMGPDHPVTAASLDNLAQVEHAAGDLTDARSHQERALGIRERALGADHPDTMRSLDSLGLLLRAQRDLAQARSVLERVLATNERVKGPEHPDTAASLNSLAGVLREQGDLAAARPLLERALALRENVLGADHPVTAASLNNLARLLQSQGELDAARHLLTRALVIRERALGADHIDTAASLHNLALLLMATGEPVRARHLLERALTIRDVALGADHPATISTRTALGR